MKVELSKQTNYKIELEFTDVHEASVFQAAMKKLWTDRCNLVEYEEEVKKMGEDLYNICLERWS